MKIIQAYPDVQYGDAISSIMFRIHEINVAQGWEDTMVAYTSQVKGVEQVGLRKSYTKAQMLKKFMQMPNKKENIRIYLKQRNSNPTDMRKLIKEADIRIWHLGITYKLMEQNIQPNDFIFFHSLNYPYLSTSPESIIESYKTLTWLKALKPRMVAQSQWTAAQLITLGYKRATILILPLFHTYNEPYTMHNTANPTLLAYGRYAINKYIPELAKMCSKNDIRLIAFGDNSKNAEFSQQYAEAAKYASEGIRLLGKQASRDRFYGEASIYVCNSGNEGFNMGIVESYAHSLPVLVRRGTAAEELVLEGSTGYCYDDIDEVPHLVEKIMQNYRFMSHHAWKKAQDYTLELYKERYLRILKEGIE